MTLTNVIWRTGSPLQAHGDFAEKLRVRTARVHYQRELVQYAKCQQNFPL